MQKADHAGTLLRDPAVGPAVGDAADHVPLAAAGLHPLTAEGEEAGTGVTATAETEAGGANATGIGGAIEIETETTEGPVSTLTVLLTDLHANIPASTDQNNLSGDEYCTLVRHCSFARLGQNASFCGMSAASKRISLDMEQSPLMSICKQLKIKTWMGSPRSR